MCQRWANKLVKVRKLQIKKIRSVNPKLANRKKDRVRKSQFRVGGRSSNLSNCEVAKLNCGQLAFVIMYLLMCESGDVEYSVHNSLVACFIPFV
jgi:hypothetical protein